MKIVYTNIVEITCTNKQKTALVHKLIRIITFHAIMQLPVPVVCCICVQYISIYIKVDLSEFKAS